MNKEEFELEKKLSELKHKNKMIELEIAHKNKVEEIELEKQSRLAVEVVQHDHKMDFHRIKRADEKRKRTGARRKVFLCNPDAV